MIILQIIFTIIAFIRGWKWKALIPVGIVFAIGLIAGAVAGASGSSVNNLDWISVFDVLSLIAVILMSIFKPKEKE